MTFVRKYITPSAVYFLLFIAGYIATYVTRYIPDIVYDYLSYYFPTVFVSYSPISEAEAYTRVKMWLTIVSVALAIFIVGYIALRLDNKRFEHLILNTEGFYTLPRGLSIWAQIYLIPDIVVCAIIPLIFAIPPYFIPEKYLDMGLAIPFWAADMLMPYMGIVECAITLSLTSVIARLTVIPHTLAVWRANWLTASVD